MSKRKSVLMGVLMLSCILLTGCSNPVTRLFKNIFGNSEVVYQADTRFLYSQDGGQSWSETIQEIPVNQTYYLAIEMQVVQSEKTKEEKTVIASITIPATTVLDCYLDDHPGVSITGKEDSINHKVTYDFSIIAGTSPSKFRAVFECKPLEEGRAEVRVIYDDSVKPEWDKTGTIKYVATEMTNQKDTFDEDLTVDDEVPIEESEENPEERIEESADDRTEDQANGVNDNEEIQEKQEEETDTSNEVTEVLEEEQSDPTAEELEKEAGSLVENVIESAKSYINSKKSGD